MTSIRRFSLSFALAGLFSLWFVSADGLAGAERPGVHRTPRGFKVPVYGMSRVRDANGQVGTECARLSGGQIEQQRLSRSVSRSLLRSSPRVVIQAVAAGGAFEVFYTDADGTGFRDSRDRVTADLVSDDLFFNGPAANETSRRSIVPRPARLPKQ